MLVSLESSKGLRMRDDHLSYGVEREETEGIRTSLEGERLSELHLLDIGPYSPSSWIDGNSAALTRPAGLYTTIRLGRNYGAPTAGEYQ